jgi:hypothetical protein
MAESDDDVDDNLALCSVYLIGKTSSRATTIHDGNYNN